MTEAYLDAQRRRRGSHSAQSQGELTEKDKSKTYHDEANGILGCQHYRRAAKLQCSTCNHWATCRYCHDDEEDHEIIRYGVYQRCSYSSTGKIPEI
jgi:CHY zinc finger